MVALGIFSWDRIQPAEDEWNFDWLDRIIAMLGRADISVDLASATASAPLWLYEKYPQMLPRDKFGHAINAGARQSWSASSPICREYALELCRRLAERYGGNPTVTAWHVGNEYGWNNRHDYSDEALRAFCAWREHKYGSVEKLNEAWCSSFWSQEVRRFQEVLMPRHMGADAMVNPAQQLDFERFSNDALLDCYRAERDAIAAICPDKPITTSFMISTDQCAIDYAQWGAEVDFVSNDHYFHEGESPLDELLCSDSLVSSIAHRQPWYLMEHSTSSVQWKPVNARKCHGELLRDALAHVAMGADAINFFQWRQSRGGVEAFHSAMLPHAGADTRLFRQVCETGEALKGLSEVAGTTVVPSRVGILFDAQSQWSTEIPTLPTTKLDHWHDVRDWSRSFLDAGLRADVVPLAHEWEQYDLLVLPTLFMLSDSAVQRLERYVRGGGAIVVGYATGIVNDAFQVGLGGYPGAGDGLLRTMLGVRGEEFNILGLDETVELSDGSISRLWHTCLTRIADNAETLATYTGAGACEWELSGMPAIVAHQYGSGRTWYIGCDVRREDITRFICDQLAPQIGLELGDPRVVSIDRASDAHMFHCVFNRSGTDVELCPAGEPVLLARGSRGQGIVTLHANGALITQSRR